MLRKNDEIELEITDFTDDGSGFGKSGSLAVFVPMTAIGDRVKVRILKVKKNYAYGKAVEIIEKSDSRQENDCPVFSRCGGCVYRHITYEAEKEAKYRRVYEAVKRIGGIDLPPRHIISGSCSRYRNKAQYPVDANGSAGFYAFHSHRIIPCGDCLLQPEIFTGLLSAAESWIKENSISVYDENTHRGLLRHIYIRQAAATGEIMFTAVINGAQLPCAEKLINSLRREAGEDLKSVMLNINRERTNVILGEKCVSLYGSGYITDVLCGLKIRLSPLSFYQVNRDMAEKLYCKVAEYAQPAGKNIVDLYCGAGTIGLSMADRAKEIIGVEIVPQAVKDARFNASENGIENARFICADAAEAALELAKEGINPQVVIVDPPRKGLSRELIDTISQQFCPERIVYVSCDAGTLARDIKYFAEKGYKLEEYTPVDMFPRTAHVECVCLLKLR